MYGYVFADLEDEAHEAAKGALGGVAPVALVDDDAASPRGAAPAGVVYNPAYGAAPAAAAPAPAAVASATFTGKSGNAAFAAPEASAAYVASTNDGGQEWR